MHNLFSLFEVCVLTGIVQGFVIAFLILSSSKKADSKLLLSLVLIVFNVLCIRILILTTGLWETRYIKFFPLPFELAIPPLLWLYICSLVNEDFKLTKDKLLHLIPFALSLGYSLLVYISALPKTGEEKDIVANTFYFNEVKNAEDYLMIVSSVIYWILGLRRILKYRHWVNTHVSNTDYPTYTWMRNVAFLIGVLIITLAAAILLDDVADLGARTFAHWQFFFIYLAALIYYLGFKGYLVADRPALAFNTPQQTTHTGLHSFQDLAEAPIPVEKFSRVPEEKAFELAKGIEDVLIVQKLYLDSDLSLNKLASALNAAPANVSFVINTHFNKSFRQLINEFRVGEVKKRLADPASRQYALTGIGFECGFNSEASFYRIFKSVTGMSPKEYADRISSAPK